MQKQWSKIKKHLEESLCEKLKGRVSYFATSYRHTHDGQGRVCILVDKKEIINMPFTNYGELNDELHRLREETGSQYFNYEQASINLTQKGVLTPWAFSSAYDDFCVKPIEECLSADNYVTRAIALMDKRTGRRTLEKMKESVIELPEWLQFFYDLRISTY